MYQTDVPAYIAKSVRKVERITNRISIVVSALETYAVCCH